MHSNITTLRVSSVDIEVILVSNITYQDNFVYINLVVVSIKLHAPFIVQLTLRFIGNKFERREHLNSTILLN